MFVMSKLMSLKLLPKHFPKTQKADVTLSSSLDVQERRSVCREKTPVSADWALRLLSPT